MTNIAPIDMQDFLQLPAGEVANLVRAAGAQVCVFPINGTRRWFRLEHANDADRSLEHYVEVAARTYIRLFALLFEHGIDTILSPAYGDELLTRGEEYMHATLTDGLKVLEAPDFMAFYQENDIRVHFYGKYKAILSGSASTAQLDLLERISSVTGKNHQRGLFFGLFGNDATEQIGQLAIEFFQKEKRPPNRQEIIQLYYGEVVGPATLFIGFEKPTVFDYPLLSLGNENLYFTAAPSPYLTERSLRKILYDHLFLRGIKDPDWNELPDNELDALRSYYYNQQETILGVGSIYHDTWIPEQISKELEPKG
jgi:hypothetical protein